MKTLSSIALAAAIVGGAGPGQAAETVWLHALDLANLHQGYGKPQVDRGIRGQPLAIGGKRFEHGLGTHGRPAGQSRYRGWNLARCSAHGEAAPRIGACHDGAFSRRGR